MPRPGYVYETTILVQAFNEMASNLKASFKALREQLEFDSLTRLYSRQGLIEVSDSLPHSGQGSLYLIGINKFRDINDSVGHHNGDKLLIHIAERLKQQLQDEATLARIGGDEFAVFMPNTNSDSDISLVERRLHQLLAAPFVLDGETVVIKVSIGVVRTQPDQTMSLWLRNASIALSYAKQDSRTSVCHYSPEMASASKFELR